MSQNENLSAHKKKQAGEPRLGLRLFLHFFADLLIIGGIALVFCLYYFLLPREQESIGIKIENPYAKAQTTASVESTNADRTQEPSAEEATQEPNSSVAPTEEDASQSQSGDTDPSNDPTAEEPTPEETEPIEPEPPSTFSTTTVWPIYFSAY